MRIACLQFAPRVGEIDNNLNRADAVLNKCQDLDGLDLLVLPELAFTGYNFQSLAHISPHLEPSGSGISALWARTTALKFNCNVVVGYPEKVDVTKKWPTSPEFYNSAIMINQDGETIANYRKSFLYAIDETWALEGQDGFFEGQIHGLGNVAMGICMDINPYKFEAPWHAFEFAFHVLEVEANLVIVTMAWLTRENPRTFTQLPHEPDLDTIEYWIQRLEPVIRAESDEETIVVFCNRTGIEGDAVYAGSSTVVGIKNGEVNLYGVLGRGVKEVLVVDTNRSPVAKLVKDSASQNGVASQAHPSPQPSRSAQPAHSTQSVRPSGSSSDGRSGRPGSQNQPSTLGTSGSHGRPYGAYEAYEAYGAASKAADDTPGKARVATPIVQQQEDVWDFASDAASISSMPSMTSFPGGSRSRFSLPRLGLQIPVNAHVQTGSQNLHNPSSATDDKKADAEDIPTPTAPSPTPLTLRPQFPLPDQNTPAPNTAGGTIIPPSVNMKSGASVVKVNRADSPVTPPFRTATKDQGHRQTSISEGPPSPPTDDSCGVRKAKPDLQPPKTERPARLVEAEKALQTAKRAEADKAARLARAENGDGDDDDLLTNQTALLNMIDAHSRDLSERKFSASGLVGEPKASHDATASSATAGRQIETTREKNAGVSTDGYDTKADPIPPELQEELGQAMKEFKPPTPTAVPARPPSTKSRNASISRPVSASGFYGLHRSMSQSRASIPIMASPSIFKTDNEAAKASHQSVLYFRPDSTVFGASHGGGGRPPSQTRQSQSLTRLEAAHNNTPGSADNVLRQDSRQDTRQDALHGPHQGSRHDSFSKATKPSVPDANSSARPLSRGRQPFTKDNPTNASNDYSPRRSEPIRRLAGAESTARKSSAGRFSAVHDRSVPAESSPRGRSGSAASSASFLFGAPQPSMLPQNSLNPDDEIIAMISLINGNCPVHQSATSTPLQMSHQNTPPAQRVPNTTADSGQAPAGTSARPGPQTPQASQASRAGPTPGTQTTPEQSIYEVILPPHIRGLIESMSNPEQRAQSRARAVEIIKNRGGTPKFNPPTPTAMEFKIKDKVDDAPEPAARHVQVE